LGKLKGRVHAEGPAKREVQEEGDDEGSVEAAFGYPL